jgi:hypothetical protein
LVDFENRSCSGSTLTMSPAFMTKPLKANNSKIMLGEAAGEHKMFQSSSPLESRGPFGERDPESTSRRASLLQTLQPLSYVLSAGGIALSVHLEPALEGLDSFLVPPERLVHQGEVIERGREVGVEP